MVVEVFPINTCVGYNGTGTCHAPFNILHYFKNRYNFTSRKPFFKSQEKNKISTIKDMVNQMPNNISSEVQPVFFGGDHTSTIGILQGSNADGLLWVDAHADYNTKETSPTGNYHGMALSIILENHDENVNWINNKISEENVTILGARNLDDREKERLEDSKITYYTTDEFMKNTNYILQNEFEKLGDNVHISFDVDVLDPSIAPGVSVPEEKGVNQITYNQFLKFVYNNQDKIYSTDIVEYNPTNDRYNRTLKEIDKYFEVICHS